MQITSTLTANVWKILVTKGQDVREGDQLMILESMKMEIPVEATISGRITEIHCGEGEQVDEGQNLLTIG
ncbi:MAG: acetyl-CoA carboxylase biotin carboxyl carrier protein subunit [Rhodobacteraceae bacterium]|jgi:biotin carboxyl carrier protein|nr:acetyl-CoA carboxylase biotin carboxyl carrier protein subunit [Paracoccaceae bacterium]